MQVVCDPAVQWVSEKWAAHVEPGTTPAFSILRIPFDYAVSHRPGARYGPRAILEALNGLTLYCTDKRVSLGQIQLHDAGEVDIVHSFSESYQNIEASVQRMPAGANPIFLGGDHSITDPIIRGMLRRHPDQKVGLVVCLMPTLTRGRRSAARNIRDIG
jgi:agmatinase